MSGKSPIVSFFSALINLINLSASATEKARLEKVSKLPREDTSDFSPSLEISNDIAVQNTQIETNPR